VYHIYWTFLLKDDLQMLLHSRIREGGSLAGGVVKKTLQEDLSKRAWVKKMHSTMTQSSSVG
jgi:hypothetical protein